MYLYVVNQQLICLLLFFKKINIFQVEALVGFEKSFKHLDEHEVDISSKVTLTFSTISLEFDLYDLMANSGLNIICVKQGITKPKEVKKFKGEGMPLHYSTKKGSLFVTFEVLFPSSLTEDQKKKIKEVLA